MSKKICFTLGAISLFLANLLTIIFVWTLNGGVYYKYTYMNSITVVTKVEGIDILYNNVLGILAIIFLVFALIFILFGLLYYPTKNNDQ